MYEFMQATTEIKHTQHNYNINGFTSKQWFTTEIEEEATYQNP